MNLQSEIDYFSEVQPIDQARLLAVFLHELTAEARSTYGAGADQVHDGARLRFVNEIVCRLAGFIEQLLADDQTRPADDVVLRMLLSPRADTAAQALVFNAYRRAIHSFDRYDATVAMDK
ncbi:MAG TPA: hypothetical protein VGF89_10430 [Steroidobacteraceae bacterium]|jgi:hypothetical protein